MTIIFSGLRKLKHIKWSYTSTDSLYIAFTIGNLIGSGGGLFLSRFFGGKFVVHPFLSLALALSFSTEELSSVLSASLFLDGFLVLVPVTTAPTSASHFSQYSLRDDDIWHNIIQKGTITVSAIGCNSNMNAIKSNHWEHCFVDKMKELVGVWEVKALLLCKSD